MIKQEEKQEEQEKIAKQNSQPKTPTPSYMQ